MTPEQELQVWQGKELGKHLLLILFIGLAALYLFPVSSQMNIWIPFSAYFLAKVIYMSAGKFVNMLFLGFCVYSYVGGVLYT